MRTVSLNLSDAARSRETEEILVFLVTVTHPELGVPLRMSTDRTERLTLDPLTYGTRSNGAPYYFIGAQVTLPDDRDRSPLVSRLTIFDVERKTIPMIRSVRTPPPGVRMQLVLASDPDTVEIDIPKFDMNNAEWSRGSVSFECSVDLLINAAYPAYSFNPAYFPGMF